MTPSGVQGGIPVSSRAGRVSGLISDDFVFLNRPNRAGAAEKSSSNQQAMQGLETEQLGPSKAELLNASLNVPLHELKKSVRHRVKEARERFTAGN